MIVMSSLQTGKNILFQKELEYSKAERKYCIFIALLIFLTTLTILSAGFTIFLTVHTLRLEGELANSNITEKEDVSSGINEVFDNDNDNDKASSSSTNSTLPLVSRREWLAQPPQKQISSLPIPVPYVIIAHTATQNCSTQNFCTLLVRQMQSFHMKSRKWYDIAYNFLIGGDGNIYEGRGWTGEGAHTYRYNSKSIGIAFIGDFIEVSPSKKQISACKMLLKEGVKLGFMKKDYKLFGANQLQATLSPGRTLFEEIKTWDHWSTSV